MSPSLVSCEKVIAPVRCARSRNSAVFVSPGRIVPSSATSGVPGSKMAPERLASGSVTLTRLAGVVLVLSSVTDAV